MRFCKCIYILLFVVYINNLYGQSKIKCDLIGISYKAFDKNPLLKRSTYTIQNAGADFQIQKSVFDVNSYSGLLVKNSRYNLFDADTRNQFIDKVLKTNTSEFSAGVRKKLR